MKKRVITILSLFIILCLIIGMYVVKINGNKEKNIYNNYITKENDSNRVQVMADYEAVLFYLNDALETHTQIKTLSAQLLLLQYKQDLFLGNIFDDIRFFNNNFDEKITIKLSKTPPLPNLAFGLLYNESINTYGNYENKFYLDLINILSESHGVYKKHFIDNNIAEPEEYYKVCFEFYEDYFNTIKAINEKIVLLYSKK